MESKRIKLIPKNPNPLFKKWLREWIEDAEKKKKKISQTYQKALDSLNKYPLTLQSGYDCAIIENIGPKICQMLDEKLEKHLNERLDLYQQTCYKDKIGEIQRRETLKVTDLIRSIEAAGLTNNSYAPAFTDDDENEDMQNNPTQLNIPLLGISFNDTVSGENDVEIPEDLLSSCAESDNEDSFDQLVRKYDFETDKKLKKKTKSHDNVIQRTKTTSKIKKTIDNSHLPPTLTPKINHSPISIVAKGARTIRKFNTFDNSKNHLAGPSYASSPISGFLNVEINNLSPPPVCLLDDVDEFDRLVAKYDFPSPIPVSSNKSPDKLKKKNSNTKLKTVQENPAQLDKIVTSQFSDDEDEIKYISVDDIDPLEFDVVLLVDIQETSGKAKAVSDELMVKLREGNIKSEVRKLNVGDFLWIAQHKVNKTNELVLPYIIERKRLDDLSCSIKDGRFHEQKFRLKQCGVQNVIYLIENHIKGGKVQTGLPFTTLLQAATNTQIHSKFQVKFTENNQHTILYLTVMTSFIENIFKNKSPVKFQVMEFKTFNQAAVKQRRCTVRETFIKQLLALKGLSVDIALEITKNYSTPTDLYEKYLQLDKVNGESLISKITIGELKRKIPAPISKTIYQFYMRDKL